MTSNDVLGSPRWTSIYRCIKHPKQEVILNSIETPAQTRVFRVPGVGRCKFKLVGSTKLTEPEGGFKQMAPRSKRTKKSTTKKSTSTRAKRRREAKAKEAEEEEPEEELEGLEELEDDLEEVEEEEPDEEEDTEEDEDEEEEPPKKKRSRKSKSKGKSRKGQAPPTRELPTGKHGAQEIAEIAGVDARAVRVFLRKAENKKKFPKDEELGRYAFNKKTAERIAKAVKAAQE